MASPPCAGDRFALGWPGSGWAATFTKLRDKVEGNSIGKTGGAVTNRLQSVVGHRHVVLPVVHMANTRQAVQGYR